VFVINADKNAGLDAFQEKAINKRMKEVLKTSYSEIDEILDYLLQSRGKMLRPRLVYLSASLYPHDAKIIVDIATAVELIHMASLVHDDIIDMADSRRGRESVNCRWGNQAGVLTGDYLFAAAFHLINRHSLVPVMDSITSTIQIMCTGEIKQLSLNSDLNISEEEYYEKTYRKTACLFASSCRVGALSAGALPQHVDILENIGLNLGYAYQLIDDVIDFTANEADIGKPVGNDLTQGNITLPVILALKDGERGIKLRNLLENGKSSVEKMPTVARILAECGALDACIKQSQVFLQYAMDTIDELPESPARQELKATGMKFLERYYQRSDNGVPAGHTEGWLLSGNA